MINITGDALLAGTLQLSLINGFDPVVGQNFQIINADNINGTFDIVLAADLGSGKAFEVIYNPNNVTLLVTGPLKGDLNGDGFVGIDDLNIVLGNWNQSVPPGDPLADPSGDDFVGIEDLNAVLGNWNAGTPPSYNVNIPEPTTGILLIYAIIPLAARTGRYK
ncbi:MAG: hypothetical protein R3C45_10895 [Phycisphaerales bacterium]